MIDHRRIASVVLTVGLGVLLVPMVLVAWSERDTFPLVYDVGFLGAITASFALAATGREVASSRLLALAVVVAAVIAPVVVTASDSPRPWVLSAYPTAAAATCLVHHRRLPAVGTAAALVLAAAYAETHPAFDVGTRQMVADVLYGVAVAAAAHAILATMRGAESIVREAHQEAVTEYAGARAAEASVRAAVQWDAYVHDEVLSTLARVRAGEDGARDGARAMLADIEGLAGAEVPVPLLAEGTMEAVLRIVPIARTRFDVDPVADAALPAEVRLAVVEALTESLRNVRRHAYASGRRDVEEREVVVDLLVRPGRVAASVRDDGDGFQVRTAGSALGLPVSVHGRMDGVGGAAVVRSWPGVGTEVSLSWTA